MLKNKKKLIALALSATMLLGLAACAPAQTAPAGAEVTTADDDINWPPHVEIVVPAGPGGDTDFNARLIAAELSNYLPPNFIVANVTGTGGVIGLRQVAQSPPDGGSAVFFHSAFVVNQLVGTADFGFEAFEFASIPASNPGMVLLVRSELGINTLEELFAFSQANPGQLLYGAETGAMSFAVAVLLQHAGLDVTIVDAGPASERIAMLLGGHVDIVATVFGVASDYIAEGMFVPLGIDGLNDLVVDGFDTVPSFRNQGIDVAVPFYYFLAFPEGTDQRMVDAVNDVIERTVHTNEEYRQAITTFFQTPVFYRDADGLARFEELSRILEQVDFN